MPKQYEFSPDEPVQITDQGTSEEQMSLLTNGELEESFDRERFINLGDTITRLNLIARQILLQPTDAPLETIEHLQTELGEYTDLVLADLSIADQALTQKDHTRIAMVYLSNLAHVHETYPLDFPPLHDTATQAVAILGNNIENINESIGEKDERMSSTALLALVSVRDFGTTYYKHQAADALKGQMPIIEKLVDDNFRLHPDLLELIFTYGSKKQIIRWFHNVSERFNTTHNVDRFDARYAIASLFESHDAQAVNYGKALVRKILREYHVNPADMLAAWFASTKKEELPYIVSKNLERIYQLESARPGIAERLQKECGINDVSRYPTSLLIEQEAHLDDAQSLYGLLLYSYGDHNGALYETSGALDQLFTQLHGGYQLRVLEIKDKLDLIKKLRHLKRKYGYAHKASFGIAAGHGASYGIQFNDSPGQKNRLQIADLADPRIEKTSEFFEDGATLILFSCKTGTAKGLAQKLTKTTGLKLIAPDKETNINSINAKIKNGKLDFDVHYIDEKSARMYTKDEGQEEQDDEKYEK